MKVSKFKGDGNMARKNLKHQIIAGLSTPYT